MRLNLTLRQKGSLQLQLCQSIPGLGGGFLYLTTIGVFDTKRAKQGDERTGLDCDEAGNHLQEWENLLKGCAVDVERRCKEDMDCVGHQGWHPVKKTAPIQNRQKCTLEYAL